ncbi:PqiB family protein [Desulfobulbus oligotrophicus]|uniref:MCE family protein n=1 Tax=Desulfobulbus oligotrophicus TaxID=1909699 RepID=A0A7T5VDN3_9BACT|nr:MlaD family protein [Desulfobulbus oligotrophicus]QQG65891.1 MCE family protein [Desulfobulbus oligotrophicus]
MTDRSTIEQHIAAPVVPAKRRFSLVWIVPLVALAIGGWLAFKAIRDKGPTITITFATADGLEAGKTKIKFKDVDIGQVESIALSEDAAKVMVTAKMIKGSEVFLTDQTKFWVVRPRISGGSITGLGTVLSGAYIGIDGSRLGKPASTFTGLETPPVVTFDHPGRSFKIVADSLGSLDIGSPVYYRQIQVGQVVGYNLNEKGTGVDIVIFVDAPHFTRVTKNTKFWNASGFDVSLSAHGLKIDTQSMVSIINGGIAFDLPKDSGPGKEAEEDTTFHLYADRNAIQEKRYTIRTYYTLLFDESVRGLQIGAPVELYGIKMGEVVDLNLEFDLEQKKFVAPVTVAIEPERMSFSNREKILKIFNNDPSLFIKTMVERHGLRAQLQSANLLTGQLMVNLVFVPDAPRATLTTRNGVQVVPTVTGSFERLQESVSRILTRLENVPFDQIGNELQLTLKAATATIAEVGNLTATLNSETAPKLQTALMELQKTLIDVQKSLGANSPLQYNTTKTLEELSRTLRALRELTTTLEHQPQSILFGKKRQPDE